MYVFFVLYSRGHFQVPMRPRRSMGPIMSVDMESRMHCYSESADRRLTYSDKRRAKVANL